MKHTNVYTAGWERRGSHFSSNNAENAPGDIMADNVVVDNVVADNVIDDEPNGNDNADGDDDFNLDDIDIHMSNSNS